MVPARLPLGGITAKEPRSFNSALSQSLSKALPPISASSEMPCSNGLPAAVYVLNGFRDG